MKTKPVKKVRGGASLLALDKSKDSHFRKKELKRRKVLKDEKQKQEKRGVIYLGCIPYGFFENEMYEYFSQFGDVKNVLHVRSKKTGRSCGYGFVEFCFREVAAVVAKTMDGYLTFNKIMKCRLLEGRQVPRKLFTKSKITKDEYPALIQRKKAIHKLNRMRSTAAEEKRLERLKKTYRRKMKLLNKIGIRVDIFGQKKTRRGKGKKKPATETANLAVTDEKIEDNMQEEEMAEACQEDIVQEEEMAEDFQEDSEQEEDMTEDYQQKLKDAKAELAAKVKLNLSRARVDEGSSEKLVLEVDQSDDEIQFKTPPNAVKKFVKISSSSRSPKGSIKRKSESVEDLESTPKTTGIKWKKVTNPENTGQEESPAAVKINSFKSTTPKKISKVVSIDIFKETPAHKKTPTPDNMPTLKKTPLPKTSNTKKMPKKSPTSVTPQKIPVPNKTPALTDKTPNPKTASKKTSKKSHTSVKTPTPKQNAASKKTPKNVKQDKALHDISDQEEQKVDTKMVLVMPEIPEKPKKSPSRLTKKSPTSVKAPTPKQIAASKKTPKKVKQDKALHDVSDQEEHKVDSKMVPVMLEIPEKPKKSPGRLTDYTSKTEILKKTKKSPSKHFDSTSKQFGKSMKLSPKQSSSKPGKSSKKTPETLSEKKVSSPHTPFSKNRPLARKTKLGSAKIPRKQKVFTPGPGQKTPKRKMPLKVPKTA